MLRRFATVVATVVSATLLVFLLLRTLPGDLAVARLGTDGDPAAPDPAEVAKTRKARSKKLPAPPHQTDHLAGGALLTLQDLDKMKGQPPDGRREYVAPQAGVGAVNPTGSANLSGSGKKPRKPNDPSRAPPDEGKPSSMARRNHLVREIMAKHKLSLPQASKHIKEHNLYKKG